MPTAMLPDTSGALAQRYTCLAVFLFFAISLVVPSGYSVGAALLFFGGLVVLVRPALWPGLMRDDKTLLWVLGLFFLGWVLEIVLDGQSSSRFDKPVRIICAIIALLWVLRHPPKPSCFWGGIAAGAITTGAWAAWQRLVLGAQQLEVYTLIIQFGNIAMLLGMLCLVGVGWALWVRRSGFWGALLILGFLGGLLGSLLSGSRGGWIGAPAVLLLVLFGYREYLPKYVLSGFVLAVAASVTALYLTPATGIKGRVEQAVSDVQRYMDEGVVDTSLGARFEMWRTGIIMMKESPLIGLGGQGMKHRMQALAEQGVVSPVVTHFDHLHNEFVDMSARRGLLGLALLLALYLVPLRLFGRRLCTRKSDNDRHTMALRPYALAGAVLCVSYVGYGLSQTFLSHNSGVMMFFFSLVICWAMLRHSEAQPTAL